MTPSILKNLGNTEIFYDPTEEHCFYVLIEELNDDDNRYAQFLLNKEAKWTHGTVRMHKNNIHRQRFEKIILTEIKTYNINLFNEIIEFIRSIKW